MSSDRIVAMYRLKNEEKWIEKSLKLTSEICDEIVVLDDGSIDNTLQICKKFPKVVDIHHQSDLQFDETRDKNTLLQMALRRNPDFILTLDGDEIIMPNSKKIFWEDLNNNPEANIFEFQELYIWDQPNKYRCDGIFGNTWPRRLLRIKNQPKDLHFNGTPYPGNSHCFSVPNNAKGWKNIVKSRVKLLHYGYYDKSLRKKKYDFYNKLDPKNTAFDGYKHILSGKSKLSGQNGMEFKTLHDGQYIPDIDVISEPQSNPDPTFNSSKKVNAIEQLDPTKPEQKFLYQEHIARYQFASNYVRDKTVLDVACGLGYGSKLLLENNATKVFGIDNSVDAVQYCQGNYSKNNLNFQVGDCEKLPFGDSKFDTIISFETIEHLDDHDKFLSEIKRVITDNGLLIISTPNIDSYQEDNPYHKHELNFDEFHLLLKKYFKNIQILKQFYPSTISISDYDKIKTFQSKFIEGKKTREEIDPLFFVAMCSNDKLPNILNTIFVFDDSTLIEGKMSHLKELQAKNTANEIHIEELRSLNTTNEIHIEELRSLNTANEIHIEELRSELQSRTEDYKAELQRLKNDHEVYIKKIEASILWKIARILDKFLGKR